MVHSIELVFDGDTEAAVAHGLMRTGRIVTAAAAIMVAAFSAILLMALGADISLSGEHRGPVSSIPPADMIAAFRYVFGAAAVLLAGSALCMAVMEEKPLAGPATPVEMAE